MQEFLKGGLLVHNCLSLYINDIKDRLAGKHVYMQMIPLSVNSRTIKLLNNDLK